MGANTECVSSLTIISLMEWHGRNYEGVLKIDVTHKSQIWMSKNQPRVRSNPVPLISVGTTLSWWHHFDVGYGWTTRLRVVKAWGLRSRSYQQTISIAGHFYSKSPGFGLFKWNRQRYRGFFGQGCITSFLRRKRLAESCFDLYTCAWVTTTKI